VLKLIAKPEPVEIDLAKSAIVVVDMQNAFASKNGMLDIAGVDISGAPEVVRTTARVLDAARRSGMPVIYLQMGFKPDLRHKELALRLMACRPELIGTLLTEGTWDFAIVDALKPQDGDLVVVKSRYSGFANTTLDADLRARGIRYLFFTGIATNVCVETTLRHAFVLDYWPILISDAVMPAGPPAMQEATLFNVETYFGWTIPAREFIEKV
jgi:ureidoacrylate peracid hydrolase